MFGCTRLQLNILNRCVHRVSFLFSTLLAWDHYYRHHISTCLHSHYACRWRVKPKGSSPDRRMMSRLVVLTKQTQIIQYGSVWDPRMTFIIHLTFNQSISRLCNLENVSPIEKSTQSLSLSLHLSRYMDLLNIWITNII